MKHTVARLLDWLEKPENEEQIKGLGVKLQKLLYVLLRNI
jgi:hypothetical protein